MNTRTRRNEQNDDAVFVNLRSALRGRVAVFIDAANLEKSVQAIGLTPPGNLAKGTAWKADIHRWRVDYVKLRRFFKKHSKLASISFYTARFETTSHDSFLTFLKRSGYRLVTKRVKSISDRQARISRQCQFCGKTNDVDIGFVCSYCKNRNTVPIERKANFDVEITTDAIAWIRHYDTFILFSGDSDFRYLIGYLKKQNKTIVVLARRGHISDELRKSPEVDYYQDIYDLRSELLRKTPKSASRRI